MIELNQAHCAALIAALGQTEPEQALATCLEVLGTVGLSSQPRPRPADVLAAKAGRHLALWCEAGLDPLSRTIVEGTLEVALERCARNDEKRAVEERAALLSSASFEGFFVHVDGDIVDSNARLAEMLRCDPSDLVGNWAIQNCIAAEDLPMVARHMVTGYERPYVITAICKDGTRFRAELQAKLCHFGKHRARVVAVRDVTERERTLAQLREGETRLGELANAAFDVTVLSREGVIVDAQGAFERVFGVASAQAIGRPIFDFVAPASRTLTLSRLAEQVTGTFRTWGLSASGEEVPLEVVAVKSTLLGEPVRVSAIRDLREVHRQEQERRNLERQLEQSQRLESLGVLAGGIAHDFNNLLVGVLGNADLLLRDATEPDEIEALEAIASAAEKAASLTVQLLAYAGRAEFAAGTSVNLLHLVSDLRVLLSASLSKKAVLQIEVDADLAVLADLTRLTQVLMNLLTNASDALEGGEGTIRVSAQRTSDPDERWAHALGATVGPGDWVQIQVEDSGQGMSAATRERIFEPFFTTKTQGHGLGLAACLGIITSHGGALHVASAIGQGTCVSILLPAADVAPVCSSPSGVHAVPCHVLVIDDEALVRLQLRRCLESRGYQVTEAASGREGLAALTTAQCDVVVLDFTMPELDGSQVVKEMRARDIRVPVVLASGYVDADTDQRLPEGTVSARLKKPYRVKDLLSAVETARASGPTRAREGA